MLASYARREYDLGRESTDDIMAIARSGHDERFAFYRARMERIISSFGLFFSHLCRRVISA